MEKVVGMIGGKYLPLHRGHVESILKAYTMCDELYIVLSYNEEREKLLFTGNMKPIPYKERHNWLYQLTKDLDNVTILDIEDNDKTEDKYNWNQSAEDIKRAINKPIDKIFHSDLENRSLFKKLYPNAEIITLERNNIPISATKLRHNNDIYKLWNFVPNVVKPYFTKKVCIIGTESCAKSTLTRNLAKYFNTTCVEEVGRDICEEVGGAENMQVEDYYRIAIQHKNLEYLQLQKAEKVLFIDTDSLTTEYYLKLYTDKDNKCNLFKEISKINNYDLYLFLEPDVEWVQDGTRLHGEDEIRKQNNDELKAIFKENNINFNVIKGNYHERFIKSIDIVNNSLS